MTANAKLMEAYVRFEMDRLSSEQLQTTIQEEVAALFDWFRDTTLSDLSHPQQVSDMVLRFAAQAPVSPEFINAVEAGVKSVHGALLEDETRLEELLPRERFDQMLETVVGLKTLRSEIVREVTASQVYRMVVGDILYHGLKRFILTDNFFARNLPGASSLVNLGRKTLNSAAPNMEKSIDKQLIAFINANIQETISESTIYLDQVLDDRMIWTMGDELWANNSGRTVAESARFVDANSIEDMVDFGMRFWMHLRTSGLLRRLVETVIDDFFAREGYTPIASLLERAGVTQQFVVEEVTLWAAPVVEAARRSGFLESRIRNHFSAFLAEWQGQAV